MFSEEGSVDILQLVLERAVMEGEVLDSIPGLKVLRLPIHLPVPMDYVWPHS